MLWRGEGTKGYSLQFRHLELNHAFVACSSQRSQGRRTRSRTANTTITSRKNWDPGGLDGSRDEMFHMTFHDATPTVDEQDDLYGAMQYVDFSIPFPSSSSSSIIGALDDYDDDNNNSNNNNNIDVVDHNDDATLVHVDVVEKSTPNSEILVHAAERSSLLREMYSVISTGSTFQELVMGASDSDDPMLQELKSNPNSNLSWSVRLRQYGTAEDETMTQNKNSNEGNLQSQNQSKVKGANRFGTSKRSSMKREKEAIVAMKPLLENLHGRVQLKNPDCALYVFEGLNHIPMVLVRKVASGASTQRIAPNTRTCITRTPLCPLASFIMCNLGLVRDGHRVLDPYSGSCSTLLASATVAKRCQMVGIELAGNDIVDRDKIEMDFDLRGLDQPTALIHGDCTDSDVRDIARRSVGDEPFDVILADPPYGRRERASKEAEPPLVQFVRCIQDDVERGRPLLKAGGRLIVFVPAGEDETLQDNLPNDSLLYSAGLRMISITEQPLSDTLSRWLAIYECISESEYN